VAQAVDRAGALEGSGCLADALGALKADSRKARQQSVELTINYALPIATHLMRVIAGHEHLHYHLGSSTLTFRALLR
jgi:hypothetical protein